MKIENSDAQRQDRLESWKEIADYLHCSVSTAQRRARKGMPIHRHEASGIVWAYKSELNTWFESLSPHPKILATKSEEFSSPIASTQLDYNFEDSQIACSRTAVQVNVSSADSNSTSAEKNAAFRSQRWKNTLVPVGAGIVLGIGILLLITKTAAYGAAILSFACCAILVAYLYSRGSDTFLKRGAVALFMIAAMSYSLSATTLGQLGGIVVNIMTLRPAVVYPFVTGLRFLPCFVLVLAFWVVLKSHDHGDFEKLSALRWSYTWVGILFLILTILASAEALGDFQIWRNRLPEGRTLFVGYLFVLAFNFAIWLVGRYWFRKSQNDGYAGLFLLVAIVYLPLAVTAAVIDSEYNVINKYHLDERRPDAYVVRNPGALRKLQGASQDKIGPDLASLLHDPNFDNIIRTKRFFKQDFDEPFQVFNRAVMFGYKADARPGEAARFVIIRFPEDLAAALRFDLVGPGNSAPLP